MCKILKKSKSVKEWIHLMADIVKKNGGEKACTDPEIRPHLIEEMADVLMYFNDIMLCYSISEEDLKEAYTKKFESNMTRW